MADRLNLQALAPEIQGIKQSMQEILDLAREAKNDRATLTDHAKVIYGNGDSDGLKGKVTRIQEQIVARDKREEEQDRRIGALEIKLWKAIMLIAGAGLAGGVSGASVVKFITNQ